VERGQVWWVIIGERRPVVLLSGKSGEEQLEFRAMQIVPPATAEEKRGFVVLTGEEATDSARLQQVTGSAGPEIRAIGVEVQIGSPEGLVPDGVVRVALPRDGRIFCTWLVTLSRESLVEQAGALSGSKLDQLAQALRLARIE